jgi:pyruvate dehydrogenase E2 component (dihydrolipoamide acetyltransferase)
MTTEFVMPALGADMNAGTLIRWRKEPGEPVERGEIIADVETDKATIEVEVWTAGVIERLLVEEGVKVPVGTPLALISENGAAAAPAAEPLRPVRASVRLRPRRSKLRHRRRPLAPATD